MVSKRNIQTEVDASYLYECLAAHEADVNIAAVFREMSDIEKGHALAFLEHSAGMGTGIMPAPSFRARAINALGKILGYEWVLGILMDTEVNLSKAIIKSKKANKLAINGAESNHVTILQNILARNKNMTGSSLARFESRHRSVGGNALRAAVLGGNDGLVSNFSLVMGVAGATNGEKGVLLTGIAGLLAGALSMSLGEWISVKSSQELYENQMQLEMDELVTDPKGEQRELELIYRSKGIAASEAGRLAAEAMKDTAQAHAMLVKEELGINTEEIKSSAIEAAIYSFILFAVGAVIPVIPFLFLNGTKAIVLCCVLSALGLFLIGGVITLFTGKNIWISGLRQVLFGLAAAAITFGIGRLIGISIAG